MTDAMTQAAPDAGGAPATAVPALEVREAAVNLGGVKALDGVSLTVHDGRLYGLAGPNGSGKSTLLAAISRLLDLTSGNILIGGADVMRRSPFQVAQLGLARTFQTVRLMPQFSVLENAMFGADQAVFGSSFVKQWLMPWWTRGREAQVRARAEAALDRLHLMDLRDELPLNLSYGTQRKVEIARALAAEPHLLLLDEPTAGMNRAERDEIGELLLRLRHEGVTQILVEHDLKMMVDICDHLYVLDSGHRIASGRPAEVIREPQVVEAYLGRGRRAAA
ncbi:ABC transporter ATP-binding protein [Dactylosporangium sucinum]|uniref:ABC transporter ATP-binding protein n=1 Tax=Dactylosporangium sucinum TaxID=1424081 RepID=A0A917WP96_9ACTN|nr:ABC transporter ATP-binding protein [Dactylosporangium sucinum]GGM20707.1 ABC transporter ATP-binding protein [Dactylosporangium sucinum]